MLLAEASAYSAAVRHSSTFTKIRTALADAFQRRVRDYARVSVEERIKSVPLVLRQAHFCV